MCNNNNNNNNEKIFELDWTFFHQFVSSVYKSYFQEGRVWKPIVNKRGYICILGDYKLP
jgi:hypothetical protein